MGRTKIGASPYWETLLNREIVYTSVARSKLVDILSALGLKLERGANKEVAAKEECGEPYLERRAVRGGEQ